MIGSYNGHYVDFHFNEGPFLIRVCFNGHHLITFNTEHVLTNTVKIGKDRKGPRVDKSKYPDEKVNKYYEYVHSINNDTAFQVTII